jgi:hypothetical protein
LSSFGDKPFLLAEIYWFNTAKACDGFNASMGNKKQPLVF